MSPCRGGARALHGRHRRRRPARAPPAGGHYAYLREGRAGQRMAGNVRKNRTPPLTFTCRKSLTTNQSYSPSACCAYTYIASWLPTDGDGRRPFSCRGGYAPGSPRTWAGDREGRSDFAYFVNCFFLSASQTSTSFHSSSQDFSYGGAVDFHHVNTALASDSHQIIHALLSAFGSLSLKSAAPLSGAPM